MYFQNPKWERYIKVQVVSPSQKYWAETFYFVNQLSELQLSRVRDFYNGW